MCYAEKKNILSVRYMTQLSIFGSEDPDLDINSFKLKLIF